MIKTECSTSFQLVIIFILKQRVAATESSRWMVHWVASFLVLSPRLYVVGFLLAPAVKQGFFSLFALKGQNRLARGNALGNEANKHFRAPERAKESNL